MRYKIIAIDLDGTLTDTNKEIPQRNIEALLEAQKRGIKIIVASGRPIPGIVSIADKISLEEYGGYVMAFNGGLIMNYQSKEILYQNYLQPEHLPFLYECSKSGDFVILSYKDGAIASEDIENKYVAYAACLNHMPLLHLENFLETFNFPIPKCLIVGDPEPLHQLELKMKHEIEGKLSIYRSEPFFLEVLPYGIDKAQCLSHLLNIIGIKKEEMIAIGDGYNDLSMIRFAGLGVAMNNAVLEVRQAADFITQNNNDNGGVAEAIDRFVLKGG
ncbi:MAG: HAD family phosphatase [Bacteroidaceae bacterium]|nr:HAD family phosphatase [Bacteroidaceae bacterium]